MMKPQIQANNDRKGSLRGRTEDLYQKPFRNKGMWNGHFEAITSTILGNLIAGPYLTGYLLYLGANAGQIGFITALPLLMNAILVIASAFLMEKFTNRQQVVFVTILFHRIFLCACGIIPFIAPNEWRMPLFILFFLMLCFFGSLSSAPFTTLLADMVPSEVRAKYFANRFTFMGIAAAITLFATGWGLDRVSESTGFAVLYLIGTFIAFINMITIGRYPRIPHFPSKNRLTLKYVYKPFRDSVFIKSILFVSLWIMGQGSTISLFSYLMPNIMKINYEWIGISNTLLSIVSIVAYMVWGRLNVRWSNRKLLLWVFPLNAISILLWGIQAFVPVPLMLITVYLFLGISMAGFGLLVFNFVISDTPEQDRPIYYSVYASLTGLFGFLGPLFGGLLFDYVKKWPIWFQKYGFIVMIGFIMLIASLTVSFRIFSESKPIKGEKNADNK